MRKLIFTIFGVGVLGVAIYALSPLLYDKRVSEEIGDVRPGQSVIQGNISDNTSVAGDIQELRSGEFQGIGVHNAKGTAKIIGSAGKKFIRLEDNFEVTNGPDLFVYLGNNGQYDPAAEIAPLKGNIGGQNYDIPEGVDAEKYQEVWIWCKQFSVPFARAEIQI